ncbi:hypothetical protein [Devosia limi]|uniref:Uncharacterized protein n=1 Tax=Devosia limi DSM 17137 TaxID=1121477 RepID=A0A1M5AD59_9HYPH|nr:hypothetical protein [Devosia limi]SHF28213.1 hypothetical protein SAMN02745223_02203 [Devosia limi DSM 17137]
MGLDDITIQSIIFRVLALLIIAGVQGGVLAGAAGLLGDMGPRYDNRLTILPFGHIDPLGAIGMILFGFGWAKPIAIDAGQFRIGRAGIIVVILAGFVALLATAFLLDALVRPALTSLPYTAGLTTAAFLRTASSLSIWFALFNLLPVPPLTGGLLLGALGIRVSRQAQLIAAAILLLTVATGLIGRGLGPAYAALAPALIGG